MRSNLSLLLSASLVFGLLVGTTTARLDARGTLAQAATPGIARHLRPRATQFLYVYNAGSPGIYTGEYARYRLPDLSLLETTAADGVASPDAFGTNGSPYFLDEAPQGGFAVYEQPVSPGIVPSIEQFYGVPCYGSSLATGPAGDFYVVQYCTGNVLEYRPGASGNHKPRKPIATYTGGNFGGPSMALPTYALVDHAGNLYVGDNGGGVTFFAAGSTNPVVAFPTGHGGSVTQIVDDAKNNVYSIHLPDATKIYFKNEKQCLLDPNGSVVRFEMGEKFSNGVFVRQFYSTPSDNALFSADGLSIAIDSDQRMYTGIGTPNAAAVLDYDPQQACPDLSRSITLVKGANPQVAIDAQKRFYVTDYFDNTITAYRAGTTSAIDHVSQQTGLINMYYAAINPL